MNSRDNKHSALSQGLLLKRKLAQRPIACPPSYALPPTPPKVDCWPSFSASIATWASRVQPGSPAPASPQRRPSGNKGAAHSRILSSQSIATPTPKSASHRTFDFTAIGYNAFFVHVPKTPATPSPLLVAQAEKALHGQKERFPQKARTKEAKEAPHHHDEPILNFNPPREIPITPSTAAVKPGPMLLSLPARPSRAASHLREPRFCLDVQAFALAMQANASSNGPKSPRSPLSRVPTDAPKVSAIPRDASSRFRTRRRPAPLKISPAMQRMHMVVAVSSPGSGVPPLSTRAKDFAYIRHTSLLTAVAAITSPVAPAAHSCYEENGEPAMDYSQPEVSIFEDDSEWDFVR